MVDAEETPLAAVIDDSCTLQYIEITPLDRPSDDCYKQECVDPIVEVQLEDLQDVKQEPADETDSEDPHCSIKVRFNKFAFLTFMNYTHKTTLVFATSKPICLYTDLAPVYR